MGPGKKLLKSVSYSASGGESISLAGLPDYGPGGSLAYLDGIWLDVNITADTVPVTGDTSQENHNLISRMTVTDGSEPWGPVEMTGELLAQSRYLATREEIPYQNDTNGDLAITASAQTRRYAIVYDYSAYGGDYGDFTPACRALKNGEISLGFSALPGDLTALTATITAYAFVHFEHEARAVPRIQTVKGVIPSLNYEVAAEGVFLQHFLRNSGNYVAGDITAASIFVGGYPVVASARPDATNALFDYFNPAITSAKIQNHFADPVGGSFPRALDMLQVRVGSKISRRPMGRNLKVDLTGSETAANLTHCTTYARFLAPTEAGAQFAAMGAKDDVVAALAKDAHNVVDARTKDGKPLENPRLQGFLSMRLKHPEMLRQIGLR